MWICILGILAVIQCGVSANPARESYQRTAEILNIVKRMEIAMKQQSQEFETRMEDVNVKLDRLLAVVEDSPMPAQGRGSWVPALADKNDVSSRLEDINSRMVLLQDSMQRMDHTVSSLDLQKLKDLEQKTSQLKDEVNQKLRKMMNVITASYEMNKDIKTNLGGRSSFEMTPANSEQDRRSSTEYLVQNLEELEKNIKEQLSVLTNEVRSEITGLKIVASNLNSGCDKDYDYFPSDKAESDTRTLRSFDSTKNKEKGNNLLNTVKNSLDVATLEIRQQIQEGLLLIDDKLTNMTLKCEEHFEESESQVRPVKMQFPSFPGQDLDEKLDEKKEACSKTARNVFSPKSCAELRRGGATCDGTYIIFLRGTRAVRVWCDMTTDGGGWTVIMRRGEFGEDMTSFHRNWESYKNGFGDTEGEFWLGNDAINQLTTQENNTLRVHLESFDNDNVDLTYSSFSIDNERGKYRLRLGPAIGRSNPVSNGLLYHNNHPFSTFDQKNDGFSQNCAETYKGGWWFNGCYFGFLTGEYFKEAEKRENWQGMLWYDWKGTSPLKGASMMVRPKEADV